VQPWFAAAVKFYLAFANFYCQLWCVFWGILLAMI
jgi:hypothetical protein